MRQEVEVVVVGRSGQGLGFLDGGGQGLGWDLGQDPGPEVLRGDGVLQHQPAQPSEQRHLVVGGPGVGQLQIIEGARRAGMQAAEGLIGQVHHLVEKLDAPVVAERDQGGEAPLWPHPGEGLVGAASHLVGQQVTAVGVEPAQIPALGPHGPEEGQLVQLGQDGPGAGGRSCLAQPGKPCPPDGGVHHQEGIEGLRGGGADRGQAPGQLVQGPCPGGHHRPLHYRQARAHDPLLLQPSESQLQKEPGPVVLAGPLGEPVAKALQIARAGQPVAGMDHRLVPVVEKRLVAAAV